MTFAGIVGALAGLPMFALVLWSVAGDALSLYHELGLLGIALFCTTPVVVGLWVWLDP